MLSKDNLIFQGLAISVFRIMKISLTSLNTDIFVGVNNFTELVMFVRMKFLEGDMAEFFISTCHFS